jgi:hypothetical protein
MPFVTRRKNFLDRNARHRLAERLDRGNGAIDFLLPPMRLGDDAGDGLAMPGDHHGLAAFDLVEQAGQMRLGLGRLDFADESSQIDRSDQWVNLIEI